MIKFENIYFWQCILLGRLLYYIMQVNKITIL